MNGGHVIPPVVVIDNFDDTIDPTLCVSNALLGPWTDIYLYETEVEALDDFPDAIHRQDLQQGDPMNKPVIWPVKLRDPSDDQES
jgi:hypothetical protein